jgi:dephospho-CoA kinase
MLVVGLTGGIASGKSTVVRMLEEMGARIIDLDDLSRVVVEPGRPALQEIAERFGKGVLRPDGTLDREGLGRIVFGDAEARRALEEIVHPLVWEEHERILAEVRRWDPHAIVVVDVPLLMELGLQDRWDAVVLVYAPRETQRERLIRRNGFAQEDADTRLRAQMDMEEKRSHAHFVIDNTGDPLETRRQVELLLERLREMERQRR